MDSESFLSHKRLDTDDAMSLAAEMIGRSPAGCVDLVAFNHPKAYPPPISRPIAGEEYLRALRDVVIQDSEAFGFPQRSQAKSSQFSKFDAQLGNRLRQHLRITPHEAGLEEVWNFLTLVVLPDIAAWRFPNENANPTYDRWLGRPRNVLRKAWWRAYSLGPTLNLKIGEDEGVAVMERPTFGSNPTLARVIVDVHTQKSAQFSFPKTDVLRAVMVQLRRLVTLVDMDCLAESELRELITDVYDQTLESWELSKTL